MRVEWAAGPVLCLARLRSGSAALQIAFLVQRRGPGEMQPPTPFIRPTQLKRRQCRCEDCNGNQLLLPVGTCIVARHRMLRLTHLGRLPVTVPQADRLLPQAQRPHCPCIAPALHPPLKAAGAPETINE